ncbi:hypothetical protein OURE66S_04502 [Oligella ureolytica]
MEHEHLPAAKDNNDEIDLFELVQSIWQQRILIVLITVVVTLLASVYAFTAKPVYQTTTILKPVQLKELDEINGTGVYTLTPQEALRRIGSSLESYYVRFQYFKNNQSQFEGLVNEHNSFEQNFELFNQKLRLFKPESSGDANFSSFVGLKLEYPESKQGPEIVNGLVQLAISDQRRRLSEDLAALVNNRLDVIERQLVALRTGYTAEKNSKIAALREEDTLKKLQLEDELQAIRLSLKTQRENRIKLLDEAIVIAESLGIQKPTTPSELNGTEVRVSGSVIKTEVNNQQLPLYFMGTEALEAEKTALQVRENDDFTSNRIVEINKELMLLEQNRRIEVLKNREDEDLFLTERAEKQREISRLKSIRVDKDNVDLVYIDQPAHHPLTSVKPNKKMIVILGFVLGGVLGVFAALLRSAIHKRKELA